MMTWEVGYSARPHNISAGRSREDVMVASQSVKDCYPDMSSKV